MRFPASVRRKDAGLFGYLFNNLKRIRRTRLTLEGLALGPHSSTLLRGVFSKRINAELRRAPLLFIHVPKNAGTSIKRAIHQADDAHRSVRCYQFLDPDFVQSAKIFAIVRDPRDRFLSAYNFFIRSGGSDSSFAESSLEDMRGLTTVDEVLDFIEAQNGNWLGVDSVFRPQSWYLVNSDNAVDLDALFPYSNDLNEVSKYLNAHGYESPSHLNRTERSATKLTPEQTLRVDHIYAYDVMLFEAVKSAEAAKKRVVRAARAIGPGGGFGVAVPQ